MIQIDAVERIAPHERAHALGDVRGDVGLQRRDVEAVNAGVVEARPAFEAAEIVGTVAVERDQLRGDRARDHQPLGMHVDDVLVIRGQFVRRRHTCHVDPRVHAQARRVRLSDRLGDRIESGC